MRKRTYRVLATLMALVLCFSVLPVQTGWMAEEQATAAIYVAPDGNDVTGVGSLEQPYGSIHKAKEAARLHIAGGMEEDLTIYLRGGSYYHDESVVFDEQDSGRDGYVVHYTNYPGETPVIYGGKEITGWEAYGDGVYRTQVDPAWSFNTLVEEGQRSTIARYPNTGYHKVEAMIDSSRSKFQYAVGDLPYIQNSSELEVYIWPGGPDGHRNWFANIIPVVDVNRSSRVVTLAHNADYELGAGSRYFFQGALEFLDQPGEYFLDQQEGMLYYYPYSEEPIESLEIVAAQVLQFFEFKGSSAEQPVKNIHLSGLNVQLSNQRNGSHSVMNGLFYFTRAEDIQVSASEISNSGSTAFHIDKDSHRITIQDNLIHDIGHTGVQIDGQYQTKFDRTTNNVVTNNLILRTGQTIGHGAGVQVRYSSGNVITHNRIHDSTRYSISVKGMPTTGYLIGKTIDGTVVTEENMDQFRRSYNNVIMYNDVSHANRDSQDTGLIEMWGAGRNNVIANNYIHDSDIQFSFGFGIYLDDSADGTVVENNLLVDLQKNPTPGILEAAIYAKGVDNKIRNNIVADSVVTRGFLGTYAMGVEDNHNIEYHNNIAYRSGSMLYLFQNWSEDRLAYADRNLFYNPQGSYGVNIKGIAATDFYQWQQELEGKFDQLSLVDTDPRFMDPEQQDYRLRYDSPAYRLGMKDINVADIGLTASFPFSDPDGELERIDVKRSGDQVNRSFMELSSGGQAQIEVQGRTVDSFIADLSQASITYSSETPSVATVDANGQVTAVSQGTALITVTVTKGDVSLSRDLHVLVDDEITALEIEASNTVLSAGEHAKLMVVAHYASGRIRNVTEETALTLDDNTLVSLSGDEITALTEGTANIAAAVTVAGEQLNTILPIEVKGNSLKEISLQLEPSTVQVGGTVALSVEGTLQDLTAADLTEATIGYTVHDETMATIEGSTLTALRSGVVYVKARVQLEGKVVENYKSVIIYNAGALPQEWTVSNYGELTTTGEAYYQDGQYAILSNGIDFYGPKDRGTLVHQTVPAPEEDDILILTATVDSFVNGGPQAQAGIMIREQDTDDANYYNLRVKLNGEIMVVFKNQWAAENHPANGTFYAFGPKTEFPVHLRVIKMGDTFYPYYKDNGVWTPITSANAIQDVEMDHATVLAGMSSYSNDADLVSLAQMSDVSLEVKTPKVETLELALDKDYISPELSGQLSVKGVTAEGFVMNSLEGLQYTSSNENVMTVDAQGVVSGVGPGTAVITVSLEQDGETISSHISISSVDLSMEYVTLSAGDVLKQGSTATLSVEGFMANDNPVDLADASIQFTSSDESVIAVDAVSGQATAVAPGQAEITVTVELYGVTKTDSKIVTVPTQKQAFGDWSISDSEAYGGGIALQQNWYFSYTKNDSWLALYEMDFGDTAYPQIKLDIDIRVDDNNAGGQIEFRDGSITGELLATYEIQSTGGFGTPGHGSTLMEGITGKHDLFLVFRGNESSNGNLFGLELSPVEDVILHKVELEGPKVLRIGESAATTVRGQLTDEAEADLTEATITYASSQPEVATVDEDGVLTALASGKATLTATVTLEGVTQSGSYSVIVPTVKDAYTKIVPYTQSEEWGGGLSNNSWGVSNTKPGSWMAFYQVDFGNPVHTDMKFLVEVAVDDVFDGGTVQLYDGSLSGELLGTLVIQSSGGWGTPGISEATIPAIEGIHDLFIVFQGSNSSVGNVFSIQFEALQDTEPPTAPEVTVTESTYSSVELEWTVSLDNDTVAGYDVVFRPTGTEAWEGFEGEITAGDTLYSASVTDLMANTDYEFRVTARDAAGNEAESEIVTATTERYADVPKTHSAYEAIRELANLDAFVDAGSTFRPDEDMTEVAFISAVVRALDLDGDRRTPRFYDPEEYGVYAADIERAYRAGLLQGRLDAEELLREVEMHILLRKAARLADYPIERERMDDPRANVTRAEAAQALYDLIQSEQ